MARPEREKAIKAATPDAEPSSSSVEAASTQPQSSAASRAGATDAKAQWGAAIRKRVERRKAYPRAAQGANGEVVVRMVIGTTGSLESVSVTRSSGNVELDKAALAAVRRAGRFPKAPEALEGNRHVFSLPIRFSP
ncbi:energy transducer TonB [Neotabrizicola shimadae]|uniref:Energy transducer TonB n=1 Tax=Neotabrizicola shimadae TaxID=2807096 RepID=A0A8G0ZV81_9RHOB|nr:energy transducer TonB [Neotabrizicola shimadae]QYZ68649.1 energy transducer TonB [Neotabrizicola shimadae]